MIYQYEMGLIRPDRGLFIDKGNRWYDVRHEDFEGGAKLNGTTNDWPAVNAALTYAYAQGGGIVYVPEGSLGVAQGIVMPGSTSKAVRLVGAEMHSSKIVPLSNGLTLIDHAGPSSVENLMLDGNGKSNIIGIDMNSNCRVKTVRVSNCLVALDYVGVSGSSIGVFYSQAEDVYLDTCGTGIRMQTDSGGAFWVNSNWVDRAQIRGCTTRAILLNGASGNRIVGLDCESNTEGLRLLDGQGNHIQGWFEKNPLSGTVYNLHIARTFRTAGTVIHGHGLLSFCSQISTTGSITSGAPTLTVASATNFEAGKVVKVAGAGAAAADLYSEVIAVSGTTITLADNAGTTVVGVAVTGPEFVTNGAYSIATEQYTYQFGSPIFGSLNLQPKPEVTGSRGGNAALADLLTALANKGLIVNSTTA